MKEEIINYRVLEARFLEDNFFDTLKNDYDGFDRWFLSKVDKKEKAYIAFNSEQRIEGFLYLKKEETPVKDITPELITENGICLKVGTFKVVGHNTRLGNRFIKKIFDVVIFSEYVYHSIYVTIFPKQIPLIKLLGRYGFDYFGTKGQENVYVKRLNRIRGDIDKDYPLVDNRSNNKWLLSIYPQWHTELFPDSILNTENPKDRIKDSTETNSISKIYISWTQNASNIKKDDTLYIYRTAEEGKSAEYSSVVTSICVVKEIKLKSDFKNADELIDFCKDRSVFSPVKLREWFNNNKMVAIEMNYNMALLKRLTRHSLIEEVGLDRNARLTLLPLNNEQTKKINQLGMIDDRFIFY